MPIKNTKPLIENSFGAAKIMVRQSVDDLKLHINKECSKVTSHKLVPYLGKTAQPKFNLLSKSNNFEKCAT